MCTGTIQVNGLQFQIHVFHEKLNLSLNFIHFVTKNTENKNFQCTCSCVFDLVLFRKSSCWVVPVPWECLWRLTGFLRDLPSSGPTISPASATYIPTSLPWMTSLSLFTGTHLATVQVQHVLDLAHEKFVTCRIWLVTCRFWFVDKKSSNLVLWCYDI